MVRAVFLGSREVDRNVSIMESHARVCIDSVCGEKNPVSSKKYKCKQATCTVDSDAVYSTRPFAALQADVKTASN